MALTITEECIICGACETECPNSAITAGEYVYEINPELCTECVGFFDEPQCRSVCPIPEVIVTNTACEETKEELLKKKLFLEKN